MEIMYVESESISVQGKRDEVFTHYGKEWNIREQGGGNGNWLLTVIDFIEYARHMGKASTMIVEVSS